MHSIDINDLIVGLVAVFAIALLFWGIARRGEKGKDSSRQTDDAKPQGNPFDPWGY